MEEADEKCIAEWIYLQNNSEIPTYGELYPNDLLTYLDKKVSNGDLEFYCNCGAQPILSCHLLHMMRILKVDKAVHRQVCKETYEKMLTSPKPKSLSALEFLNELEDLRKIVLDLRIFSGKFLETIEFQYGRVLEQVSNDKIKFLKSEIENKKEKLAKLTRQLDVWSKKIAK